MPIVEVRAIKSVLYRKTLEVTKEVYEGLEEGEISVLDYLTEEDKAVQSYEDFEVELIEE